jgi:hypothetical protein
MGRIWIKICIFLNGWYYFLWTQAIPRLTEDRVKECVDPRLKGKYPPKGVARVCLFFPPFSVHARTLTLSLPKKQLETNLNTEWFFPVDCSLQRWQRSACSTNQIIGLAWALPSRHSLPFFSINLNLHQLLRLIQQMTFVVPIHPFQHEFTVPLLLPSSTAGFCSRWFSVWFCWMMGCRIRLAQACEMCFLDDHLSNRVLGYI